MKTILTIVALAFSANVFALGAFEKFDFTSGQNPYGYTLGEICYENGTYISTVTKSNCVAYEEVLADEEQRYRIMPRTIKMCVAWEKIPAGQVVPNTIKDCIKWEMYDKNEGKGKSIEWRSRCIESGQVEVKRTQRLDVYISEIGQNLTSGQSMGSAMYTVPACSSTDIPSKDLPDTKK